MPEDDTNEAIRDDLDNYGSHLLVFIEDPSGALRRIESIRTRDYGDGPVIILQCGELYRGSPL